MIGYCLIGQAILSLVDGATKNPIYQLFQLVTSPPRKLVARCFFIPLASKVNACLTFVMCLLLWFFLAYLKQTL